VPGPYIVRKRLTGVASRELALAMADPTKGGASDFDTVTARLAFEELMVRYQRQVIGTALRLLGNRDDARDAAQEVFYRLYKHFGQLDPGLDPGAWLYRVTVNVCHDVRRKRTEFALAEGFEAGTETPGWDAGLDMEKRREVLQRALRRLPEKERAAVVLREVEGLSTAEVAEALGSSEATVRSQVSMAKVKLRNWCEALLRRKS
jgi:RNA polymerase sigma-70 factor (ECF subfamily)